VFTGEELQADVRGSQLLGELQAAAQALVLVDDEGGPRRRRPDKSDRLVEFGPRRQSRG